eukprot:s1061_g17.t1
MLRLAAVACLAVADGRPAADARTLRVDDFRTEMPHSVAPSALLQPPADAYSQLVDREELTVKKGDATAFCGVLGFAMLAFYAVQQGLIPELRTRTWRLLSGTGSLFITVLLFMAMKKSWKLCAGASTQESRLYADIFSCVRFLILLFGVPALLRWRDNAALRILGTHLIGFAGADAFADVLRRDPFALHAGYYLLGVISMVLLLLCLLFICKKLRGAWQEYDESKERQEHEATGFIIGFLISMFVRFAITGSLPGSKKAGGITLTHLIWMMAVAGASMKLYVMTSFLSAKVNAAERSVWFRRSLKIGKESCAMTMAWMIFYFVQWFFWHVYAVDLTVEAGKYSTALSVAVTLSGLVMLTLLLITFVAQKLGRSTLSLTELDNVFSLQTGFAWEMAFYAVTVSGVTSGIEDATAKALSGVMWIMFLLLLVAPPWYLHMVPKVAEEKKPQDEKAEAEAKASPESKSEAETKAPAPGAAAVPPAPAPAASAAPAAAPAAPTPAPAAPEVKPPAAEDDDEEF